MGRLDGPLGPLSGAGRDSSTTRSRTRGLWLPDAAAADLPAIAVWRVIDTASSFAHPGSAGGGRGRTGRAGRLGRPRVERDDRGLGRRRGPAARLRVGGCHGPADPHRPGRGGHGLRDPRGAQPPHHRAHLRAWRSPSSSTPPWSAWCSCPRSCSSSGLPTGGCPAGSGGQSPASPSSRTRITLRAAAWAIPGRSAQRSPSDPGHPCRRRRRSRGVTIQDPRTVREPLEIYALVPVLFKGYAKLRTPSRPRACRSSSA